MHPRILAVVPAMREDVHKMLRSLLGQTVAPERVIVAVGSRNLEKFLARNLPLEISRSTWECALPRRSIARSSR